MVAVALLALAVPSDGDDNIVGYRRVTIPAGATVVASVPFSHQSEGPFTISDTTGTDLLVDGNPFGAGEYNGTHYVRITSGAAKGRWSTIEVNGTGSITLEDTGFLGDITDDVDTFKIYKHVTLAEVFTDALLNISYKESTTKLVWGAVVLDEIKTQVGIFADPSVTPPPASENKVPDENFVYVDGTWRNVSNVTGNADGTILPPESFLWIKNGGNTSDLSYVPSGTVSLDAKAVKLVGGALTSDTVVGGGPVSVKLKDLGLGGTAAFVSSTLKNVYGAILLDDPGDYLLLLGATGTSASETYVYAEGHWRNVSNVSVSADDDEIGAAQGFIIRKEAGGGTEIWVIE
jgi:uncharacterized protein (TIGR02597 family)